MSNSPISPLKNYSEREIKNEELHSKMLEEISKIIFLKTIIPSRKATRIYLGESHE